MGWFDATQEWVDNINYSHYKKGIVEIVDKVRKLLLEAEESPHLKEEIKKEILEIASKREFKPLTEELPPLEEGRLIDTYALIPTKHNKDWRKQLRR